MDEIGIVKKTEGVIAMVSMERKSACDSCKAGCTVTDSEAVIEAINEAKATVGQRVRVVMRPYHYLKGSILIYGVPAAFLIIGAIIGKEYLSGFFPSIKDPDYVAAAAGFGLLFLSLLVIKIWSRNLEKKTEYKPVVAEILE